MSYRLQFEERTGYLYVYVEGQDSYEVSFEYWRRVGEKALELGFKKVLVEENLTGQASDMEIADLTSQFREFGFHSLMIAFVDRDRTHDEGNRLGETVARNRGANARIFSTVAEAEVWLLSGGDLDA